MLQSKERDNALMKNTDIISFIKKTIKITTKIF